MDMQLLRSLNVLSLPPQNGWSRSGRWPYPSVRALACSCKIMQDTLLQPVLRPRMEADWCTQEHGGVATRGTYMDGCPSTCLEELIHVMLEMKSGLVARPEQHWRLL